MKAENATFEPAHARIPRITLPLAPYRLTTAQQGSQFYLP
jgi:hypothetical protein